jgi:hypothetical protein
VKLRLMLPRIDVLDVGAARMTVKSSKSMLA